jgi:hypothetical protein
MGYVRFEVFMEVTMKNGVFWVVTPFNMGYIAFVGCLREKSESCDGNKDKGLRTSCCPIRGGYWIAPYFGPHILAIT